MKNKIKYNSKLFKFSIIIIQANKTFQNCLKNVVKRKYIFKILKYRSKNNKQNLL